MVVPAKGPISSSPAPFVPPPFHSPTLPPPPARARVRQGTRMIHEWGDLWARSTSALEANQSEVGRTLDKVSCKRRSIDVGDGQTQRPFTSKDAKKAAVDATDLDQSMAVSVSKMKVTSAMAQSAAKHFIATQAYCQDTENAIVTRETDRLVLGLEARSTRKRQLPKIEKVAPDVDQKADSFTLFLQMMTAEQPQQSPQQPGA